MKVLLSPSIRMDRFSFSLNYLKIMNPAQLYRFPTYSFLLQCSVFETQCNVFLPPVGCFSNKGESLFSHMNTEQETQLFLFSLIPYLCHYEEGVEEVWKKLLIFPSAFLWQRRVRSFSHNALQQISYGSSSQTGK